MTRFFENCRNLSELKAEYRRLAMANHPDRGGDTATMQAINAEYDRLAAILPAVNAQGETYEPAHREEPSAFRDAVMAVINLDGVQLEICGCWLWATGNTRPYAETFKAAGYTFSAGKRAWYWKGYKSRRRGHNWSMDDIRSRYGSMRIEREDGEREERDALTA